MVEKSRKIQILWKKIRQVAKFHLKEKNTTEGLV
jgi:hypothetical protein